MQAHARDKDQGAGVAEPFGPPQVLAYGVRRLIDDDIARGGFGGGGETLIVCRFW